MNFPQVASLNNDSTACPCAWLGWRAAELHQVPSTLLCPFIPHLRFISSILVAFTIIFAVTLWSSFMSFSTLLKYSIFFVHSLESTCQTCFCWTTASVVVFLGRRLGPSRSYPGFHCTAAVVFPMRMAYAYVLSPVHIVVHASLLLTVDQFEGREPPFRVDEVCLGYLFWHRQVPIFSQIQMIGVCPLSSLWYPII